MNKRAPLHRWLAVFASGALALGGLPGPGGSLRAAAAPDDDPVVRAAFEQGTLTQGQRSLETALAAPATQAASAASTARRRYALGIVQFLRAAERLGQSWRHFGLNANGLTASLPFLRLPVGQADLAEAAPVSYEDFRGVFVAFLADVQGAEATFAALPDDPGKVSLRPGLVHLDYVGDGQPAHLETVWRTYLALNKGAGLSERAADDFRIAFDAGDVPWFRGYCHLLSALAEGVLAYDESRLFDHTAQLFFERPQTPFPFLLHKPDHSGRNLDTAGISDLIAFIHLLNFPLREPARLQAALAHLTQVTAFSRESWRRILAETDDDREWIPNPRQTGVLPGVKVTQERVDAWLKTLDEADALLAGRKLLPFWRGGAGEAGEARGVNLRRVFTEPQPFDLVLWLQGTGAAPYLEKGEMTDAKLWRDVQSTFGGETLGFALYFN